MVDKLDSERYGHTLPPPPAAKRTGAPRCGEVSEWLKERASKACVPLKGTVGSNPTLSAMF